MKDENKIEAIKIIEPFIEIDTKILIFLEKIFSHMHKKESEI